MHNLQQSFYIQLWGWEGKEGLELRDARRETFPLAMHTGDSAFKWNHYQRLRVEGSMPRCHTHGVTIGQ